MVMIDNIKNINSNGQMSASKRDPKGTAAKEPSVNNMNSPHSTNVELSSDAQILESATQSLISAPEINQEKIEAIKQAIDRGEYKIDPEAIAKKIFKDIY
jgi:negative regulator of flagellin synthesis FlgM